MQSVSPKWTDLTIPLQIGSVNFNTNINQRSNIFFRNGFFMGNKRKIIVLLDRNSAETEELFQKLPLKVN